MWCVIIHPPLLDRWYGYGWCGLLVLLVLSDGWPSFFMVFFAQLVHHKPGNAIAPPRRPRNVITNRELAKLVYTAKHLFALHHRRRALHHCFNVTAQLAQAKLVEAGTAWAQASAATKEFWEHEARNHDAKQPAIVGLIVEVFRQNPTLSFDAAASHKKIDNWCSGNTIGNLFRSLRYSRYMERVLPLMTRHQRREAVRFARKLRSNWGRGGGKYLYITFDEKWFFGLVLRHAKMCEALGLKRGHLYAKHKNHITKTMVVAFVAYAFEDNMENGGTGVLLGVHRIESARIAQKMTREAEFDDEGNHTFSGPVVRRMGDAYAVDCELTGSNSGTSSKPKCSLLELFRTTHIPQVETLVGPGGLYEGYIPVWQPDGGSAHVEGTREGVVVGGFMQYITDLMQRKGWLWEPQAAQMPYINACDLFLFPLMSRLHARMLREIGGMPSPDVIWEHVKKVFRDIPSADVAKAHLLAYRVAEKVIAEHGGNHFLDEGGCHAGIGADFISTNSGIIRKDGKTLPPPS